MTRETLYSAIESNRPFVISMAAGRSYSAPHRDCIAFNRKSTAAFVVTEKDRIHTLPLITMTGILRRNRRTLDPRSELNLGSVLEAASQSLR